MSRIPINPGESVTLKAFRVTKWALERGGKFTGKEMQAQFGLSKSKSYKVAAEWRQVFGKEPPRRARRPSKAQLATMAPSGDVSESPQVKDKIDLASLLNRR